MFKNSAYLYDVSASNINNLDMDRIQHNNGIIENLHENDFVYLEKDLEFHDKV